MESGLVTLFVITALALVYHAYANEYSIRMEWRYDTDFPENIPTSTTELELTYNHFTVITGEQLHGLNQVTKVTAENNKFTTFPNLTYMAAVLHTLNLDYNPISHIDAELLEMLTALQVLWLANNDLTSIPNVVGPIIYELDLRNNKFTTMPALDQLAWKATVVYLQYNDIDSMTVDKLMIGQDNGGQSLEIDLDGNLLESLPPVVTNRPELLTIKLMSTVLHCDEKLVWLYSTAAASLSNCICNSPQHLLGMSLDQLSVDDLLSDTDSAMRHMTQWTSTQSIHSNTMPLSRTSTISPLECASLCALTPGCLYFNYLPATHGGECHYADPVTGQRVSDIATVTDGWVYYQMNAE